MDPELVKEAIRSSDLVQLDEMGNRVRANSKRVMLLVRGIPEGTSHEVSPTVLPSHPLTPTQHVLYPSMPPHGVLEACMLPLHCIPVCFRFSLCIHIL